MYLMPGIPVNKKGKVAVLMECAFYGEGNSPKIEYKVTYASVFQTETKNSKGEERNRIYFR